MNYLSVQFIIFSALLFSGVVIWLIKSKPENPSFVLLLAELLRLIGAIGDGVLLIQGYWAEISWFWRVVDVIVCGAAAYVLVMIFASHLVKFFAYVQYLGEEESAKDKR